MNYHDCNYQSKCTKSCGFQSASSRKEKRDKDFDDWFRKQMKFQQHLWNIENKHLEENLNEMGK